MKFHRNKQGRKYSKTTNATKGELFKELDCVHDFALPQQWLDDFTDFITNRENVSKFNTSAYREEIYNLIRSTTVWAYPTDCSTSGCPITVSIEVYDSFAYWEAAQKMKI